MIICDNCHQNEKIYPYSCFKCSYTLCPHCTYLKVLARPGVPPLELVCVNCNEYLSPTALKSLFLLSLRIRGYPMPEPEFYKISPKIKEEED